MLQKFFKKDIANFKKQKQEFKKKDKIRKDDMLKSG